MIKFWVKVIKSNVNCKYECFELDTKVISTCSFNDGKIVSLQKILYFPEH